MSRKEARETVFKLIYERSVVGEINDFSYSLHVDVFENDDKEYIKNVYFGINDCWDFLEQIVEKYSREFRIERVYKIDLSLLAVAVFEILFLDSIPFQVATNEAIELSKKYSTEKSYKFINGILSSIIKDKSILLEKYKNTKI